MPLKGVIMAGGEGKRFRPLTYYLQKCMIPVGEQEKPILEYIIRLLKHHGINDVSLLISYRHKQVVNYFNDGARFGVKIKYVLDPPNMTGSANAILNAYKTGAISQEDTIMIYYGDILSDIDISEMLKKHRETKAIVTVALAKTLKINEGVAEVEGNRIKGFVEKPALEKQVSIGMLVFDGAVLDIIEKQHQEGGYKAFDIMGDVVSTLVRKGEKVVPYLTDAFWYDVGSIERYERLDNNRLTKALGFLFK